jgi:hypothetical protein
MANMADKAGAYSPFMDAMAQRSGTSTQEPLYAESNVDEESEGRGPAMGQRLADAMNPPPVKSGNYVLRPDDNNDNSDVQYHYNVNAEGVVQFRSPISGKTITLKPSDTAPHKKKAYEAIMKQIAQAQRVPS